MIKFISADLVQKGYPTDLKREDLRQFNGEFCVTDNPPQNEDGWVLSWAFPARYKQCSAIETGFFYHAMHIDRGLYHKSTLNDPKAQKEICSFKAPRSAADIVLSGDAFDSKYKQHQESIDWDGVVLAAQVPHDRSIQAAGGHDDYWKFVEAAAKKYGKKLLVKWHPMACEGDYAHYRAICNQHGCNVVRTNHTAIQNCKFVLVYNSSFSVDCFLRGVPVAQYETGYFYRTGAVTYTNRELPDSIDRSTVDKGYKLADFLMYRYCFTFDQPLQHWVRLFRHFSQSEERFPLPIELSYGANLEFVSKQWRSIF